MPEEGGEINWNNPPNETVKAENLSAEQDIDAHSSTRPKTDVLTTLPARLPELRVRSRRLEGIRATRWCGTEGGEEMSRGRDDDSLRREVGGKQHSSKARYWLDQKDIIPEPVLTARTQNGII
jgi:hypothetical protein